MIEIAIGLALVAYLSSVMLVVIYHFKGERLSKKSAALRRSKKRKRKAEPKLEQREVSPAEALRLYEEAHKKDGQGGEKA